MIFEKKGLLTTECVFRFSLQILSEAFLMVRRNEPDVFKTVYRSSCEVPVVSVQFEWNLDLSTDFRKFSEIKF
jgi:hypothetical protein